MLKLILMRHGAAESPGLKSDFERRLTPEGEAGVHWTSQALADYDIDQILASPASRTQETAAILSTYRPSAALQTVAHYYDTPGDSPARECLSLGETRGAACLVGHNPVWSHWASTLSGDLVSLRPGAAAVLEQGCGQWSDASFGDGEWQLVAVIEPGGDSK